MAFSSIIWDLDEDPEGNVQHCLNHDVTKAEVMDVVQDPASRRGISRSWAIRPCSATPAPDGT